MTLSTSRKRAAMLSLTVACVAALQVSSAATGSAADGASFHTEYVTAPCGSTNFYLNYNPTTDNFSDAVATFYEGNPVNIRDAPNLRAPRGLDGYEGGRWGFFDNNCIDYGQDGVPQ
jgi:hypothetical protein